MINPLSNSSFMYIRYLFEMIDPVETWGDKKEKVDEAAKPKVTLFLIMPQNDFHEKYGNEGDPDFRSAGSLAVTGSNEDATRIKNMIDKNIEDISHIIVALDTHHLSHIAHAVFWVAGENNPALKERMTTDPSLNKEDEMEKIHPAVFTIIDYEDIENEIWMPYHLDMLPWVKYYTKELRRKNKQKLCIWPEHCLIGSEGHAIVKPINDAIQRWATRRNRQVKYVLKGENLRTEMFSVLKAEVVDDHDPTTSMDWELMADLQIADKVYICGQALRYDFQIVINLRVFFD